MTTKKSRNSPGPGRPRKEEPDIVVLGVRTDEKTAENVREFCSRTGRTVGTLLKVTVSYLAANPDRWEGLIAEAASSKR